MLYVNAISTRSAVGRYQCNAYQVENINDHTYHDKGKKHCSSSKVDYHRSTSLKQ